MSCSSEEPVKQGDKVAVITRSQCRYEGSLQSCNKESETFTLSNVRVFGTENRSVDEPYPPSERIYDFVEFKASDVQDFNVVPSVPALRDPAIINMRERLAEDEEDNLHDFDMRHRYSMGRPFNASNSRFARNDWKLVNPRSEGRFPQKAPGVRHHSLEEFDFEEGINEFSRLKLSDSAEDVELDRQSIDASPESSREGSPEVYNKEKSFFDNLSGASDFQSKSRSHMPMQRRSNPNVETFGEETVRQLYEIRRYAPDQRSGYRKQQGFRRYNNYNNPRNNGYRNESMAPLGYRGRQNFGQTY